MAHNGGRTSNRTILIACDMVRPYVIPIMRSRGTISAQDVREAIVKARRDGHDCPNLSSELSISRMVACLSHNWL